MSGKKIDELSRAIDKRFNRASTQSFFAVVKEVDDKKRTCKVTKGTLEYIEVLLYATFKEDLKGSVFIPKIGSQVVVSRLQGTDNLFVSQFSEIDKVLLTMSDKHSLEITVDSAVVTNDKSVITVKADQTEIKVGKSVVKVTDKGLTLAKEAYGLLKTLEALCDAITQLTVSTAVGPSSPPINLAQFTQIKTELKNYMEG